MDSILKKLMGRTTKEEKEGQKQDEKKEDANVSNEDEEFEQDEKNDFDDEGEDNENNQTDLSSKYEELLKKNKELESKMNDISQFNFMPINTNMPAQQNPEPSLPIDNEDVLKKMGFDSLAEAMDWEADEKKGMKNFMLNFMESVEQNATKKALKKVPPIVQQNYSQKEQERQLVKEFYKKHPELSNVKPYVTQVASALHQNYASRGLSAPTDYILNETAKRVYSALQIKKGKEIEFEDNKKENKKPAFSGGQKGSRKKKRKIDNEETLISQILKRAG
jgi:hypothetical protein